MFSRCKKGKFQEPLEIPSELKARLADFSQKNVALKETLRTFKGTKKSSERENGDESLRLWEKIGSGQWVSSWIIHKKYIKLMD